LRSENDFLTEDLEDAREARDTNRSLWQTAETCKNTVEMRKDITERRLLSTERELTDLKIKMERMQPYVPRHL